MPDRLKMTRKRLFMGLLFVVVLAIVLSLVRKSQKPKEVLPPVPNIQSDFKGTPKIIFDVDESKVSIPQETEILYVQFVPLLQESVKNLAKNLGLTYDPIISEDVINGTVYIWSGSTGSLTVTPKLRSVYYISNKNLENLNTELDDAKISETAKNFITSNFNLSADDIKETAIKYLKNNPLTGGYSETDKQNALVYQAEFNYVNADYQIVNMGSSQPLILVRMLKNGDIYDSQLTLLGKISKSAQKYPLKSLSDIKSNSDKAVVIEINNVYTTLDSFAKNDIDSITIYSIEYAYLLEKPDSTILTPVYLLKATGKSKSYPQDLVFVLYLPALKNQ